MSRHRISLLGLVVLAVAVAPACTESRGGSVDPPADAAPTLGADGSVRLPKASLRYLRVETVQAGSETFDLRVPARVEFRDDAVSRVGAPAGGRVASIAVKTGDRVRAGQPLLTMASPDAASARNAVASARAALREARAGLLRQQRMMDEGVGIERERLESELRLSQAQAEDDRAEAMAGIVGDGRGADLVVRSPMSGTVITLKASVGAAAEPGGEPLIEVGNPDGVWVVADVSDHDLALVREGSPAEVSLNASASPLAARVVSIGSVVDNALRTAPVRLALTAPVPGLRPGTFGRARIKTVAQGATLPTEAVLIRGGQDCIVYVAKGDDVFERRSVVVGRPLDGRVQVLSGVAPGDRVVVSGALLLDGSAEQLL
jgi:cobalt-zinc-cadmium efflux system membrane fusion protein